MQVREVKNLNFLARARKSFLAISSGDVSGDAATSTCSATETLRIL
jgi:hypothetical protein